MTEKKSDVSIELGNDPSLALKIFTMAKNLEYLLNYTPQYAEVLKAVRGLTAANIEVTEEQQKRYADAERIFRDITRRAWEKEKEGSR